MPSVCYVTLLVLILTFWVFRPQHTLRVTVEQRSLMKLSEWECVSSRGCRAACVMRAAPGSLCPLHMCRAQGISLIPQLSAGFAPHNGVVAAVSDPGSNFCTGPTRRPRHMYACMREHMLALEHVYHVSPLCGVWPCSARHLWPLSDTWISCEFMYRRSDQTSLCTERSVAARAQNK